MSLSGMVEIPRLQAKRGFVMPAQAGIHLRFRWKAKENLDSGLRRSRLRIEKMSRLPVDEFRTARLEAEGHSVAFFAANSPLPSTSLSSTARRRRSSGLGSPGSLSRCRRRGARRPVRRCGSHGAASLPAATARAAFNMNLRTAMTVMSLTPRCSCERS